MVLVFKIVEIYLSGDIADFPGLRFMLMVLEG